jgi:hypothetical protein
MNDCSAIKQVALRSPKVLDLMKLWNPYLAKNFSKGFSQLTVLAKYENFHSLNFVD